MASTSDQAPLVYPPPLSAEQLETGHEFLESTARIDIETPILIVGGGPVGMIQALMLVRLHSQSCMLIERETSTTIYPKMEYTNGRSMEIYRALGLQTDLRAVATAEIPEEYENDELIVTSLAEGGKLIHTWARDGAKTQREKSYKVNDGTQYTEPHMRCHQILIEKILKKKVESEPKIQSSWGTAFVGLTEQHDHVLVKALRADGTTVSIKAQYVIGCDGGGSRVRRSVDLESKREHLNMTVAFVHFRSHPLRAKIPFGRFWHANVLGGGVLVSQNEVQADLFTVHFILPPGIDPASLSTEETLALAIGGCQGPVPVETDEVLCRGTWKVDVAIANKFQSKGGRVLLAGDSAHQLSPIGGHGLNSGIGDAFDLAWKLSATLQGWAGKGLLETYDTERRQIAFENLGHVQRALGNIVMPIFTSHLKYGTDLLNGNGEEAEKARSEVAELSRHGHWFHNQNGNILGYSYKESPIVIDEAGERPKGTDSLYVPTTWPGSQMPRLWMKDGKNTSDVLSTNAFNVVELSAGGKLSQPFMEAAQELGIPLKALDWHKEEATLRKVYERDLVLVRPDMHVAWRSSEGDHKPISKEEASKVLRTVTGHSI